MLICQNNPRKSCSLGDTVLVVEETPGGLVWCGRKLVQRCSCILLSKWATAHLMLACASLQSRAARDAPQIKQGPTVPSYQSECWKRRWQEEAELPGAALPVQIHYWETVAPLLTCDADAGRLTHHPPVPRLIPYWSIAFSSVLLF